jgi:hypothetical protein
MKIEQSRKRMNLRSVPLPNVLPTLHYFILTNP